MADVELRVISEPRYLCVVRSAVETFTQRIGFSNEQSGDIVLAVDEALTNVIRHGYKGATNQPIRICLSHHRDGPRDGICIVIEDECDQVDPAKLVGHPLEEVKPGGLGVNIFKQVMDDVQFEPAKGKRGMLLTLCKYKND
jgi:anti-sigma regulatory factor (Ser/Thr protein kinase)